MSLTLTPSSSSSNSIPASLTSFSTSTPDSQSSQSSFSQNGSQRPRYARRRNIATFVSHSDSEDDIAEQSQPAPTASSAAQPPGFVPYIPRQLPSTSSQASRYDRTAATSSPNRSSSQIRSSPNDRAPTATRSLTNGRIAFPPPSSALQEGRPTIHLGRTKSLPQLGRTKSLPQKGSVHMMQLDEGCESLPAPRTGLKRGFEGDSGDEGEEADDEESQGIDKAAQDSLNTHVESSSLPSQLNHLDILFPDPIAEDAAATSDDAGSADDGNNHILEAVGEEMEEYEPELWDDFWAEDEPTAVIDPTDNVPARIFEAVSPGVDGEGDDGGDGDVLARLLARAEKMRAGIDPDAIDTGKEDDANAEAAEEEDVLLLSDPEDEFDEMMDFEAGGDGSRRAQALAFLESLPLKFLSQLNTSLIMLNEYERTRVSSKKAVTKSKAGKSDDSQEKEGGEEMGMLLEEPEDVDMADGEEEGGKKGKTKVKGGEGGVEWEHVGIELGLINRKTGTDQVVSFPDDPLGMGAKATSQRRFAEIMRVASLMYEAILTDTVTTKRDIFYKDVALFRTQATVDKLVDDIAASAGLKRQDFMVCATSKGLIASSALKVFLKTGEELSFSATNASLIPPIEKIDFISSLTDEIDWVLIVEKDAVFQTLCGNTLLSDPDLGSGVIITGKGYPDLATLQLVSLIATTFPAAHVHALVDADPHGLDILSVYTLGSQATRFSHDHADLALGERLEWMGVKASEFNDLGVRFDDLLPLSEKDVQKAMAMLTTRPDMPESWRRELVHMLHLNKKAEIQVLAMRGQGEHDQDEGEGGEEGGGKGGMWEGGGNGVVGYVVGKLLGA